MRLTEFGLERRNRTEILEDITQRFKDRFGVDISTGDSSVFGKFIALLSELELEREKMAEEVYYNRTISGAEGIYLDDIASRYGVFRRGKVAGSGIAHVQYDDTFLDGTTISTTDTFSSDNGRKYSPIAPTTLSQSWAGMVIEKADVALATYNISLINPDTLDVAADSFTPNSLSDADIITFFGEIAAFIIANTSDNDNIVYVDETDVILYVGYSNDEFIGLTEPTNFTMSPKMGLYWSGVEVECNTKGYFENPAGAINGFSNGFTGYIEATNGREFDPGSEVETDAELRIRMNQVRLATASGTRDGIVRALLALDNVNQVRIYDNPTSSDTPEADAFTFHVVIDGGLDSVIAQTIYDNKPINTATTGTTSVSVDTADGDEEVIKFSRAVEVPLAFRITYVSADGVPLTASEKTTINTAISNLLQEFRIGGTVYNTQTISAVLSSVGFTRMTDVTVEVKEVSEPDGSYSELNKVLAYNEIATVDSTNIIYIRSL